MIDSYRKRGLVGVFFFAVGFVVLSSTLTVITLLSMFGYIMTFQSQPNPLLAWELVCDGAVSSSLAAFFLVPVGGLLEWLLVYRAEEG